MTNEVFDLDAFEREGAVEPFRVKFGGQQFTLLDLKDLDYREAIEILLAFNRGEVETAMKSLLPEAEQEDFFAIPMPSWKLQGLIDQYKTHHGITDNSLGEALAPRPSSRGTAARSKSTSRRKGSTS